MTGNRDKINNTEVIPFYELIELGGNIKQLRWGFTENITDGRVTFDYLYINISKIDYEQLIIDGVPDKIAFAVANNWHLEKPIQLIISNEIKTDWLLKKQEHDILGNYPDISSILEYVKSISTSSINEGGNLYIYLDELFEQHRLFLESFGVIINKQK